MVERVWDRLGGTTLLSGVTGSGRSAVLELASTKLASLGFLPVVVAPPPRHYDTAAIAMLDTAVGLAHVGLADGMNGSWSRPATWSERTRELQSWLKTAASMDEFVLLIDDPARWSIPEAGETSKRLEATADTLLRDVDCTRVIAAREVAAATDLVVDRLSAESAFHDRDSWGPLADIAAEVGSAMAEVASRPPADIGIVVALAAVTSVDAVQSWWDPKLRTEQLADALVDEVRTAPKLRRLWAAWLAASLPRRSVDPAYTAAGVARIGDEVQVAIVERCLLAPGGTRLAREARAAVWRAAPDSFTERVRADAATRLNDYYLALFEAATRDGDPARFIFAAEALHLVARVGPSAAAQTLPAPFSDQFNAVGMAAMERLDFTLAATAFDLALEVDQEDPLATHYLGFSLDHDALEPLRVEEAYRRAIELDGSYATWHSRLICFLIVQARTIDARRRWAASRAHLLADEGDSPVALYARLHLPVAANLLRRAELAMTYEVLDDVPASVRPQLVGYRDQRHRLEVLDQAQEIGSVVPAYRASPKWWTTGPELLGQRHEGRPLQMWMAGGVEAVDAEGVHLTVAVVRPPASPRIGTTTLGFDFLLDAAVDVARAERLAIGDFVEIGYYGQGSELATDPVVRVLPRRPWIEGVETTLDPSRYIRRASW